MKSTRIACLRMACTALLCGVAPFAATLAADATPVTAQQLVVPKASSKVDAVLWTRRSDRYTLQVVLPRPTTAGIRIQPIRNDANVTLWLLKADGTVIPAQAEPALGPKQGVNTSEVAYSVSLSAGETAVAAALKIDGEYFIEALRPLN